MNETRSASLLLALCSLCAGGAFAHENTVTITGHYDNAVGSSDAASQGIIGAGLLASRAAQRPGEVLEFVPGVIVTQHSGDGKANQYFLRGFNLDHGTDFAVRLNGVPVNLPSHGHGQGYADVNMLIPELVRRVDYRKGPYHAASGDFSLAGGADIAYRRTLEAPLFVLSVGPHQYRRAVAAASGDVAADVHWLAAVEAVGQDGPWTQPEGLSKRNAVFTLSGGEAGHHVAVSLMAYRSRWTATDQIPERAQLNGVLGRFDTLDATAGGRTHRTSLNADWQRDSEWGRTRATAWVLDYGLALASNFTYALERGAQGDQFTQTDRRVAAGLQVAHGFEHTVAGLPARTEFGLQVRHDRIRVGLFDSVQRVAVNTVREDRVRLWQGDAYAQTDVELAPRLRAVVGVRADAVGHEVKALSLPANSGRARAVLASPKLSLVAGPFFGPFLGPFLGPDAKTELFFNAGRGFHSNDARGTTARVDPRSGAAVASVPALAPATGIELGLRTEPFKGVQSSLSLWRLRSSSELVYLGDAGSTEAQAASRRHGVEWSNRWVPAPWLLLDADLSWSQARFHDGTRIPNAVDRVAGLGLTVRQLQGWSANLQGRYVGSAALVEDNAVRSRPAFTTQLRVARSFSKNVEGSLDVFNLLNRKVDDVQYFYASKLPGEASAVEDRHSHPAQPRSLRLTLRMTL